MEKKWNLQDIRPTEKRRPARAPSQHMEVERVAEEPPRMAPKPTKTRSGRGRRTGLVLAIVIFLVVAAAGYVLALLTAGAAVTAMPKFREPTINGVFEAKKEAASGELPFELLTLDAEGEREVTATGQEDVTTQATGKLTIYKTTPGQERLIKNTRFATADGLVFRATESVVVPGSTDAGPGKVTADVFADQAGPEYNLAAGTKFTVPGFKEGDLMDLYNAIYAENDSPMTGGYKGPRYIVNDDELKTVTDSLHLELEQALQGRVASERPAGFTLFPNSYVFVYQDLPSEDLGGGKVKLKQKATLQAPIFKNEDFASALAAASVPGYEHEPVKVEDSSVLTFEYASTTSDLASSDSISFKLTGKPRLIWQFDAEQLKRDLAGKAETALNTVLGGYPAIEKATATIRPFWRRAFPENPSDITIVESLETNSK